MQITFTLTVESNKQPSDLIQLLLTSMSGEKLIGFEMPDVPAPPMNQSDEDRIHPDDILDDILDGLFVDGEDAPKKEVSPEKKKTPNFTVNYDSSKVQKDLLNLTQKEFCEKYDVSKPTFYSRRKTLKKNLIDDKEMYVILRDPKAYAEENNISDLEVQTKVKICRELYHEKYNTKYPAVFNYAGKFPDKVVGARYGISGSTVCVLRKMMGIPKYRKNQ